MFIVYIIYFQNGFKFCGDDLIYSMEFSRSLSFVAGIFADVWHEETNTLISTVLSI